VLALVLPALELALAGRTPALKLALDDLLALVHPALKVGQAALKFLFCLGLLGLPVISLRVGDKLAERLLPLPKFFLAGAGLPGGPLREAGRNVEGDRAILRGERGPDGTKKTGQGLPVAGALVALRPLSWKIALWVDARQVGALRPVRHVGAVDRLPARHAVREGKGLGGLGQVLCGERIAVIRQEWGQGWGHRVVDDLLCERAALSREKEAVSASTISFSSTEAKVRFVEQEGQVAKRLAEGLAALGAAPDRPVWKSYVAMMSSHVK
jgi:hypothetical protein